MSALGGPPGKQAGCSPGFGCLLLPSPGNPRPITRPQLRVGNHPVLRCNGVLSHIEAAGRRPHCATVWRVSTGQRASRWCPARSMGRPRKPVGTRESRRPRIPMALADLGAEQAGMKPRFSTGRSSLPESRPARSSSARRILPRARRADGASGTQSQRRRRRDRRGRPRTAGAPRTAAPCPKPSPRPRIGGTCRNGRK